MKGSHVLLIWAFLLICVIAMIFPRALEALVCNFFATLGQFLGVVLVFAIIFWGLRKIVTGK